MPEPEIKSKPLYKEFYTTKYLLFQLVGNTGKTVKYLVLNKDSGITLGEIKWYGSFRKYGFFTTNPDAVYDTNCLQCIRDVIADLEARRKHD